MQKNLIVRLEGNNDVAIIEIRPDTWRNEVKLAEIVPTDDPMVHRRINHEALVITDYPELHDLLDDDLNWNWEAVENLAIGYLNRQSNARVKLCEEWATELAQA